MPNGLLLVDDHRIRRDGIKTIIERTTAFCVVGEAANGRDAVTMCRKLEPALVVMDIVLPDMNGIEATTEILRHCPTTKVIVLSIRDDEACVLAAFRSGARAFLTMEASSADLMDALRTVSDGGFYLSGQVSQQLLSLIQRGEMEFHTPALQAGLSPREEQVLRLVVAGNTNKEIAVMLDLAVETVRTYRKALMKKTGVKNVAGLVQVALTAGLAGWNGVGGNITPNKSEAR
jgi:DNA-binding NarL/FixJ family response regulator